MDKSFNAEEFFARLQAGGFNGHLGEVLKPLSVEQLEQIAALLTDEWNKANPQKD